MCSDSTRVVWLVSLFDQPLDDDDDDDLFVGLYT